jgi:hypothetical protein
MLFLNTGMSRRIRIVSGESDQGPRIGGTGPTGITAGEFGEYLLTLPLDENSNMEVSIFLSENDALIASAQERAHENGNYVWIIPHGESSRSNDDVSRSRFEPRMMIIEPPTPDWAEIDDQGARQRMITAGHKIGGKPYMKWQRSWLTHELDDLSRQGFLHFLQLDFPSRRDANLGRKPWPFGDGLFHLYGRPPFAMKDWVTFWQL